MQRPNNGQGTDKERLTILIYRYTEYKVHTHNRASMAEANAGTAIHISPILHQPRKAAESLKKTHLLLRAFAPLRETQFSSHQKS